MDSGISSTNIWPKAYPHKTNGWRCFRGSGECTSVATSSRAAHPTKREISVKIPWSCGSSTCYQRNALFRFLRLNIVRKCLIFCLFGVLVYSIPHARVRGRCPRAALSGGRVGETTFKHVVERWEHTGKAALWPLRQLPLYGMSTIIIIAFSLTVTISLQLSGEKHLTLFDPHHNENLYEAHIPEAILTFDPSANAFSRNSLLESTSMVMSPVDILRPDLERFPNFATAGRVHCVLQPGDVLFMPAFWWHEVQSYPDPVERRNLAINFWYIRYYNYVECYVVGTHWAINTVILLYNYIAHNVALVLW